VYSEQMSKRVGFSCLGCFFVLLCAGTRADAQPRDRNAEVSLAAAADEATWLRDPDSGMAVSFRIQGASSVAPKQVGDHLEYRGALAGDTVVVRRLADGVEDHLLLRPGSARGNVRYTLQLDGVAGLRTVGNALELLDADGAPRLRVAPPFVVANGGAVREAILSLIGCNADRSPLPPWNRPVVAPGRNECELIVSWDPAVAAEGAVLDPLWVKTADMAVKRNEHSATLMDDGRVLVGGEKTSAGLPGKSTELYDPTTGTWAMGGQANASLNRNLAARLGTSKVLFVMSGGTQIYDYSSGTFSDGPQLTPSRFDYAIAPLPDGSVLATGGDTGTQYLSDAQIFDVTTEAWVATSAMHQTRARHGATPLASGKVLVTGGVVFGAVSSNAEIYDPTSKTWSNAVPMGSGHDTHVAVRLTDGRVLAHGGSKQSAGYTSLYDPGTGTWTSSESGAYARYSHSGVALPDGSALVTGGYGHDSTTSLTDPLASAEVWAPTGHWALTSPMISTHVLHTTTLLSGDQTHARVLVAGGDLTGRASEILDGLLIGQPCSTASDCFAHQCVDGVCCDSACNSPCTACAAALKDSGPDGACGPVKAQTDPHSDCDPQDPSTCGRTGECDGQGQCALHPAGTECKQGECYSDQTTFVYGWTYACDGQGSCDKQQDDCCYFEGTKLDYCSCHYGVCDYPSGGTGGSSGGGGGGNGGTPSYGGSPMGGGTSASGGSTGSSSSDGGCGCSLPRSPRDSAGWLLVALLAMIARRRRRRADPGHAGRKEGSNALVAAGRSLRGLRLLAASGLAPGALLARGSHVSTRREQ